MSGKCPVRLPSVEGASTIAAVRKYGRLGALLQAHMEAQLYGGSQAALARLVGVGSSTVGKWMHGDSMPTVDNLTALAQATGIEYGDLLDAALVDAGYKDQPESPQRGQSA